MIVLDTHVLIWWATGDAQLSAKARHAIAAQQRNSGHIERDRIVLTMDVDEWLAAVQGFDGVRMVPVSPRVAVQSVRLPGTFHKDPADRMIVALAREMNAPLLTADTKIHDYPHVRCIW